MSIQPINLGAQANDGSGDGLRTGGEKINTNFQELDARVTAAQNKANEVDLLSGEVDTLSTAQGQLAGRVSTLETTSAGLDQRLASVELEEADHDTRITALETSGGGGSGTLTPTFPEYLTNTLTRHYLGRQKTVNIAAVTTTNVVVELESPFMAFRIGLPNAHSAAVSGIKVKVGLLSDRAPQAWLVDITPDSDWIDVTWGGAATATLAARHDAEVPSITMSDEIKYASYLRTDTPTTQRPLILIRIEFPAGSVATYPYLGISNWRQGTYRYMAASTQQTDGVTTPANYTQTLNTEQNVCIPTIQYYVEKSGKQLMMVGDSTVEGVGGSPLGAGAVPIAAWRLSTPDNPIEYANLCLHAQYPVTYQKMVGLFYDLIRPTHLIYSPYSVNAAAPTVGLTADEANNLRLATARTLDAARSSKKPLKLIFLEGLPVNAAGKDLGPGDSTRVDINVWLNTKLVGPVIATGYAAAISGVVDVDGQMEIATGMTTDNLHPNSLGYETLADIIQPLLAAE